MTFSSIRLSDIFTTGEIFFKLAGVKTVAEREVNIVFSADGYFSLVEV